MDGFWTERRILLVSYTASILLFLLLYSATWFLFIERPETSPVNMDRIVEWMKVQYQKKIELVKRQPEPRRIVRLPRRDLTERRPVERVDVEASRERVEVTVPERVTPSRTRTLENHNRQIRETPTRVREQAREERAQERDIDSRARERSLAERSGQRQAQTGGRQSVIHEPVQPETRSREVISTGGTFAHWFDRHQTIDLPPEYYRFAELEPAGTRTAADSLEFSGEMVTMYFLQGEDDADLRVLLLRNRRIEALFFDRDLQTLTGFRQGELLGEHMIRGENKQTAMAGSVVNIYYEWRDRHLEKP